MPRGWKDGVWTEPGTWSQEAGTQIQPSRNLFCMTLCTSLSLGINFSVGKMKVCMALDHVCKRKQCVSKCTCFHMCGKEIYPPVHMVISGEWDGLKEVFFALSNLFTLLVFHNKYLL